MKTQETYNSALEQFLLEYRERNIEYYIDRCNEYARTRYSDEYQAMKYVDRLRALEEKFGKTVMKFVDYRGNDKEIQKAIIKHVDRDVEGRRYNFIKACEKHVGTITDIGHLYISINGEINGRVYGEKGTAVVETIGAGGYNIQRYHFRVLVKKEKGV